METLWRAWGNVPHGTSMDDYWCYSFLNFDGHNPNNIEIFLCILSIRSSGISCPLILFILG